MKRSELLAVLTGEAVAIQDGAVWSMSAMQSTLKNTDGGRAEISVSKDGRSVDAIIYATSLDTKTAKVQKGPVLVLSFEIDFGGYKLIDAKCSGVEGNFLAVPKGDVFALSLFRNLVEEMRNEDILSFEQQLEHAHINYLKPGMAEMKQAAKKHATKPPVGFDTGLPQPIESRPVSSKPAEKRPIGFDTGKSVEKQSATIVPFAPRPKFARDEMQFA